MNVRNPEMPRDVEAIRREPRPPPSPKNPDHDYVNEWTLSAGDHRPTDRSPDTDDSDLSANNQLGAE